MNKELKLFIIWLLMTFLMVIGIPLVEAQQTPSSQSGQPTNQQAGVPVVFDGETLFIIQESLGGLSPQARATKVTQSLQKYAQDYFLSLDELRVFSEEEDTGKIPLSLITTKTIPIITLSNRDAKAAGTTRSELAETYLQEIKEAISQYRQKRSKAYLIRGAIFTAIYTLVLLIALFITNNIFAQIYQWLRAWGNTYIRGIRLRNLQLVSPKQLDNLIFFIARIIQALIVLGLFIFYFPLIFSQFYWTQRWAEAFWKYVFITLRTGWQAFVAYLPNLLIIILVVAITYLLLRLSKPFFRELSEGTFSLPGFYREWALTTYRIVSFLTIALAAVIIVPLLPGFDSPAFQGISVFLGILLSLGSTSIIANVVAGTILIYTRAFRIGDRIRIDDIFGQVIETTLLVTRLLTPTNEVISIPNSQIITSSIVNLNFATQELNKPLIMRIKVYLGYEIPWRQAYEALIQAALQTDGIAKSPAPFVLQGELNEVYVTYLLNVYVNAEYFKEKTPTDVEKTRSQLHENIRDCCQKAGIRIFAPSYEADPTAYGPVATGNGDLLSTEEKTSMFEQNS